jgi:hypothetical protein
MSKTLLDTYYKAYNNLFYKNGIKIVLEISF